MGTTTIQIEGGNIKGNVTASNDVSNSFNSHALEDHRYPEEIEPFATRPPHILERMVADGPSKTHLISPAITNITAHGFVRLVITSGSEASVTICGPSKFHGQIQIVAVGTDLHIDRTGIQTGDPEYIWINVVLGSPLNNISANGKSRVVVPSMVSSVVSINATNHSDVWITGIFDRLAIQSHGDSNVEAIMSPCSVMLTAFTSQGSRTKLIGTASGAVLRVADTATLESNSLKTEVVHALASNMGTMHLRAPSVSLSLIASDYSNTTILGNAPSQTITSNSKNAIIRFQ